jgi:hypothetical protein
MEEEWWNSGESENTPLGEPRCGPILFNNLNFPNFLIFYEIF